MNKIYAALLITLMVICYAAVSSSCNVFKHSESESSFDSSAYKEALVSKRISDSTYQVFLKRIKELETNVQFGNVRQCDDDSLRAIINDLKNANFASELEKQNIIDRLNLIKAGVVPTNEVTTHADGSTTYKGQIVWFRQQLKESADSTTKLRLIVDKQDSTIRELKKSSGKTHSESEKKTSVFPWWIFIAWFAAGMLVGAFLLYRWLCWMSKKYEHENTD